MCPGPHPAAKEPALSQDTSRAVPTAHEPVDTATPVAAVGAIGAVPAILRLITQHTGMRFSAVAHVTDVSWTACAVHDELDFGLSPGSQLDVHSTLCIETRAMRAPVVIDHASTDPVYSQHLTPRLYRFESYVSVPIILADGTHFGNLCALDPLPLKVSEAGTMGMFRGYADLIALLLDSQAEHGAVQQRLADERSLAVSREQFIAVVAHDLRNPLSSVASGTELITRYGEPAMARVGERMKASVRRMAALLDDLVDFAKGRSGRGITIEVRPQADLGTDLRTVVNEIRDAHPTRAVLDDIHIDGVVDADAARLQQLLSNLLGNAIAYGAPGEPVRIEALVRQGDAIVSVTNGGEVIPPEHLSRLFDAYWRPEAHKAGTSMGLGLYICAQIMRAHRGTLNVTSSAERGTRFEARWPVSAAGPSAAR